MPSFYTITNVTAQAQDVNQIIAALRGDAGQGIPLSPTAVNDSTNFALALKNADPTNSRVLQVLRANNNILIQADASGVVVSPDGGAASAQVVNLSLAQTLTNKTLTAAHLTSPVIDSGGITVNGTSVFNNNVTVSAGGVTSSTGDVTGRRFKGAGNALATTDFVLGAGWGNTAAVTTLSGTDERATFTITAQGTGIAANPLVTLTFHDGTWTTVPFVLAGLTGGTGANTAVPIGVTPTATTVQFQMFFTPVAATTYAFTFLVIG